MIDGPRMLERSEGFVDVGPGKVWYEMAGQGPTIVLLHGGPGASSDYLVSFMQLVTEGYRVVRYEQLGSRRSDKPDDPSLWQIARFVEELEIVRRELDLGQTHLLGQSWGVILALEYALHHQEHLRSLILYSGAASVAEVVEGMQLLRSQLSPEQQETLARHEATGETDHPDYMAALNVLYGRHFCRLASQPAELAESSRHLSLPVYQTMWGPNEFVCTGNLAGWNRIDRLGEIRVPALITGGRHDEVVPSCAGTMHQGLAGSRLCIFENSAHLAHMEEPDRYFSLLREFLASVDSPSQAPFSTSL
jgi:proline-specific peptidase